jgi:hypothetical protein
MPDEHDPTHDVYLDGEPERARRAVLRTLLADLVETLESPDPDLDLALTLAIAARAEIETLGRTLRSSRQARPPRDDLGL